MTGVPRLVLFYGLLGVIPFVAPPMASLLAPALRPLAAQFAAFYAALILSFLGGARWGLAVARPRPEPRVVTLAMLPTLAGLALLLVPDPWRGAQLLGLAGLLAVHWLWDRRAAGVPGWYGRLRSVLTAGAVTGLLAQAVIGGGATPGAAAPAAPGMDSDTRSVRWRGGGWNPV